jgi:integrase/recombinase XerC
VLAPRSARLLLVPNVVHLDPAGAVFAAMKEGWARQQSARFLRPKTVKGRLRVIERLWEFTGLYPWQWTPAEGEAFIADLRSQRPPVQLSTARTYEVTIGLFVEYLLDSRYEWRQVCAERFGEVPQEVFHEGNSVLHTVEYEGDPARRPLTYDEIQALFDAADARPSRIRRLGRKGALTALRDAAVVKTVYAYGLRRTECSRLDRVDLRHNPRVPQYGGKGTVMVRYGKAPKGGPAKRRSVLTVPEMDWSVGVLDEYLAEMRPHFGAGKHPALWLTERAGRLSPRSIDDAFVTIRRSADLDEALDLHCLRHSYITHLIEFGYPEEFVRQQVGHSHASTTAIYMGVSNEFRNALLEKVLRERLGQDWE